MSKHGGKREGSGRKKKADEIQMIEQMDAVTAPKSVWEKLFSKVEEGDVTAIKTWLQYRFGMPKQTIDQNVSLPKPARKYFKDFGNEH